VTCDEISAHAVVVILNDLLREQLDRLNAKSGANDV
jgi:hypothetical protein